MRLHVFHGWKTHLGTSLETLETIETSLETSLGTSLVV